MARHCQGTFRRTGLILGMCTGLSVRAAGLLGLATLLGYASGNGPGARLLDQTVKGIDGQMKLCCSST